VFSFTLAFRYILPRGDMPLPMSTPLYRACAQILPYAKIQQCLLWFIYRRHFASIVDALIISTRAIARKIESLTVAHVILCHMRDFCWKDISPSREPDA